MDDYQQHYSHQAPRLPESCPPGFGFKYRVIPGDTMWNIAQLFGISAEELAAANPHIPDPSVLYPGDELCVPENPPPLSNSCLPRKPHHCPTGFMGRYTVMPGDSMWNISQRYGVNLTELINANPHITDPSIIYPGDVLCVPPPPSPPCRPYPPCPPYPPHPPRPPRRPCRPRHPYDWPPCG